MFVCYSINMDKNTVIQQILVFSNILSTNKKYLYNELSEKTIDELKTLADSLEESVNKLYEEEQISFKTKMRTIKNPYRDAFLEVYKLYADKDEFPIDIEDINENSIGHIYNSIWFEDINGLPHLTRYLPISAGNVPGHFCSQVVNNYDLSSMKEEEIHPFLTKLFCDFFELLQSFKTGIYGNVVEAMCKKIAKLKEENKIFLQRNNQPSFVISVLPKGEFTEIYLDYDIPYGDMLEHHIRNKFIINNSTQKITFNNKVVDENILNCYANCLL